MWGRTVIEMLPQARDEETPLVRSLAAAETLQTLVGYWTAATRQERLEYVRLFVPSVGLAYDLRRQQIAAIQPRLAFLRPLQLALADWQEHDGVLYAPDT